MAQRPDVPAIAQPGIFQPGIVQPKMMVRVPARRAPRPTVAARRHP